MLKKFDVKNQNDPNLKDATNEIYKLEHSKGVMDSNTGEYKGLRVDDARDEIIKLLIDLKKGDILFEFAERPVICRCGTKCVVKILDDQWFLGVLDETWKKKPTSAEGMKVIPEEVRPISSIILDGCRTGHVQGELASEPDYHGIRTG